MRFKNPSFRGPASLTAAILWLLAAGVLCTSTGCLSDADQAAAEPLCPPFEPTGDFRVLNSMMERRCGELDCHGAAKITDGGFVAPSRPLVVYGQYALRRSLSDGLEDPDEGPTDLEEYYPGGFEPTTIHELRGTYESMCGLEPEEMDMVRKGAPPETLTLIRKPRLEEKHKGGRLWSKGSLTGDACLISWVLSEGGDAADRRAINKDACRKELEPL
jgi:hypothetical protein